MKTDRSDLVCNLKKSSAHPGAGGGFVACAVDTVHALPLDSIQTTFANESLDVLGAVTMSCTSLNQCNQQFSVTAVTTSAGSITERYAYSPYGELTILNSSATPVASSAIDNRYTYTGREWDSALKLYHFRSRMMSPVAGRFLGRDPISYNGSEWNLYEYCNTSPLNFVDPIGLACGDIPDSLDPASDPEEPLDIDEISSSLMGCLKSPALLRVCIDTGVVQWGTLGAKYGGKNGGKNLVKLLEKWGGEVLKGGKGSHTKVKMPNGSVETVPLSPGNGTVISILKNIIQ